MMAMMNKVRVSMNVLKKSFSNKNGQNEKELSFLERIKKNLELNKEAKYVMTSFLFKFLMGYGIGYIIYAVFHYFQNGRLPTIRFGVLVVYLFVFSACIGSILSNFQEQIQRRVQVAARRN